MKIASIQSNICIKSNNPKFKYKFKQADVPLEVEESHIKKILANKDFYESDAQIPEEPKKSKKPKKEKTWMEELMEINGIGKKTAEDIISVFPKKSDLLEALANDKHLPFSDDVVEKLKEVFIH